LVYVPNLLESELRFVFYLCPYSPTRKYFVQVVLREKTVVRVRVLNLHVVLWHKVSIQKNIKMSMKQALLDKSYTQAIVKWPLAADQEEKLCENK